MLGFRCHRGIVKYALPPVMAVFLAACNSSPPVPSVFSFAQTPLTKRTTRLALDWSSLGEPGRFVIADVLSYSGAEPKMGAPEGWTLIRDDASQSTRQSLYLHVIRANERSVQTWTFSQPVDTQGVILFLDDVATVDPVDATSGNTGSGSSLLAKSVKTTTGGDLILAFYATDFVGTRPDHDAPEDMSAIVDQIEWPHAYWILGTHPSRKGDTGDAPCTSAQVFTWVAAQVAIKRGRASAATPNLEAR